MVFPYHHHRQWEGVFVPVVPLALMDVLDSPVPALVGVQAPFDPLSYALDGVNVLDLDARQSSVSWLRVRRGRVRATVPDVARR